MRVERCVYSSSRFGVEYNYQGLGGLCMVHEVRRLRRGFSAKDCSQLLIIWFTGYIWVLSPQM